MTSVLIVATSDNHLGRYYARMSPKRLDERRAWLRRGFEAVVDYAIAEGADLLLHAGDLFDTADPSNADLAFVADCLQRLHAAGVDVYAVGGNHDTPSGPLVQGGVAPLAPLASLHGLTFFDSTEPQARLVQAGMVELRLAGMTPRPGDQAGDPLLELWASGLEPDIFLTHAAIEGHGVAGAREPLLRKQSALDFSGLRLVVAGHVHKHAVEYAGGTVLVAPGATEHITFGEVDSPPGFVSIRLSEHGVEDLQHLPVGPQPRIQLTVSAGSLGDEPDEQLRGLVERHASPDTMLKLSLSGTVTRARYQALRLRELSDFGVAAGFYFELEATELYLDDQLRVEAGRGVRVSQQSEIEQVAAELAEAAGSDRERELILTARDRILERYSQ